MKPISMGMGTTKGMLAWLCLIGVAAHAYACGGACSDAQDLCEECELNREDSCAKLFDDADSGFCEDAIATYEAECAEE